MSDVPLRNLSIRQLATVMMLAASLPGGALLLWGMGTLIATESDTLGALLVAAGLGLVTVSVLIYTGVQILLKAESNINRLHHDALDLIETLHRIEPMIKRMEFNSEISDAAKSITHREKEVEAVRQAIREDMYAGNWEAAVYLIDDMEKRFGYKQETQELRNELNQVRNMTIEEKIVEAVSHIEKHMGEQQWERARQEIERLLKLFPRHERILSLPSELSQKREEHKKKLLTEWNVAVQREEIDHGVEILTQLDQYLTREEAESLRDSARHVFKARLLNLGVKFAMAAQEHRWRDALEVCLQIRDEFPNSRMAHEVEGKLETLRIRAGFVSEAEMNKTSTTTPEDA